MSLDDRYTPAALAAGVCVVLATVPYAWAAWRRTATPNRATWAIYLVVGVVGTASMAVGGARVTLVVPFLYALGACIIFALSLRHGQGGWSRLDQVCLATAGASLALWGITGDPRVAVILTALADLAGTVPTIRKAWLQPASEPRLPWLLYGVGSGLAVASAPHFDIIHAAYPAAIALGCVAVNAGLWRPRLARLTP